MFFPVKYDGDADSSAHKEEARSWPLRNRQGCMVSKHESASKYCARRCRY